MSTPMEDDGFNPLFLKQDSVYVYDYNIESLRNEMDKKLLSVLSEEGLQEII